MAKKGITKREIRYASQLILTGIGIGLVSDPVDQFFSNIFGNDFYRILAGAFFLGIALYLFKIK